MSGDPGQDYFSDGITDDIITDLSRFSELLVIARNSSFQYKGTSVDIRQVGRELGVRYVLEGSIRHAGDRIRISAQLIDATTGAHRWADRYDRKLDDTFAVQDEVVRTIVAVLAVHVNKAETERALAKPPAVWLAYDHYLRAAHTLALFNSSFSKVELLQARRGLDRVLAIDPNYARAHAALSRSSMELWIRRWDDDRPWTAAIETAHQSAREAVRLAPNLSDAYVALGWALSYMRQHEAAITEFERATQLNPNFTDYHFAFALLVAGEPAKAIQTLEAHMRLDPFYQARTTAMLGFAYYLLGRYLEALPHLQEAASRAPNHGHSRRYLAATYAQLGQLDRAREEAIEAMRVEPWFTISQGIFARICKRAEDAEHFSKGLDKAGFPE
jgi:adenylate cyclase